MPSLIKYSLIFCLFLLITNISFAQKSNVLTTQTSFYEGPFEDITTEAKRTGKPIILTFVEDWCNHCQKMTKTTFNDKSVANKLNQNYLAYQVDGTTADGKMLIKQFNISDFPAVVVLDKAQKIKGNFNGYHQPQDFLKALNGIETGKKVKETFWDKINIFKK